MLTFIEERRRRIRKAYEEGREEGSKEIIRILSSDPRIADLFREDPKIREKLRELGIEPTDQRNDA